MLAHAALKSQATRGLSVSIKGVATIGRVPILPPAAPNQVHIGTTPATGGAWLNRLNTWRANTGVTPLSEDTLCTAGDYDHALYMVEIGDVAHLENPSSPCYTAADNTAAETSNIFVSSSTAQIAGGQSASPEYWSTGRSAARSRRRSHRRPCHQW